MKAQFSTFIFVVAITLLVILFVLIVMHWHPITSYPLPRFIHPKSRPTSSSPTSNSTSYPPQGQPSGHSLVLCSTPNGTDNRSVKQKCCSAFAGVSLGDFCGVGSDGTPLETQDAAILQKARDLNCSCEDIMFCRLGYGTALSKNHYNEAQDMIASVQYHLPNTRLIVYDLGLSEAQRKTLSSYCNVELRSFKFEEYPPHVRTLQFYSWKPLIAKKLSEEFEVFMYGDSSVRVMGSPMQYVFPLLRKFPFVSGSLFKGGRSPIVALTHDKMVEYLHVNYTRKEMGHFGQMEAGCWAMWPNTQFKSKFLNSWVDCALHQECIAPPGSSMKGCNFDLQKKSYGTGQYIGCHRYDQSAMGMILIREFGLSVWNKAVHTEAQRMWKVEHYQSHHFASICQCTDIK